MSDKSYTSKPVIHYRDSSKDSYSSRYSTEGHYSSSKSSTSSYDQRQYKHRTADHEDKYITSKYSGDGKVRVINQEQGIYDKDAPRSGDASAQHYKESSKHRSSHKHKR